MRRFIIIWIALLALLSTALVTTAQDEAQPLTVSLFVSCIDNPSESGLPRVWFGYEASEAVSGFASYGPSEGAGFIGAPADTLDAGRHEQVFAVELQSEGVTAFFDFVTADGSYHAEANEQTAAPTCDAIQPVYGPDGGLKTVSKDVAPGCYEWSIADDYGHWSSVATTCSQAEGDHVFVRLVLGRDNSVTDPERYKVWRVED